MHSRSKKKKKKKPISDFQTQFSMSKIIRIFLIFFIEEYQFRGIIFVVDTFWKLQFFKVLCLVKSRLFFDRLI